jgi:hypothetical protein
MIRIGAGVACLSLYAVTFQGCSESPIGGTTEEAAALFPEAVTLDISEFPDDETDPDARQAPGVARAFVGQFERTCKAAGAIMHGFHRLYNRGLALGAQLNDDLIDPEDPTLEGSITVAGREVAYKADFSPFDIDGDGTPDGSGRFDTDPVAVRLWVDTDAGMQRFLCALITTRPSAGRPGAGSMYIQPGVLHPLVDSEFRAYVFWDHTDEDHRWHEAFTNGRLRQNVQSRAGHHRVERTAVQGDAIQKTVKSTTAIDDSDFAFSEFKFAGRTIEDTGVALFNIEAVGTPSVSVTNQCISLNGCNGLSADSCQAIDTEGMEFLSVPDGSETAWPADFPAEPTF